jgi:hypothetical protein
LFITAGSGLGIENAEDRFWVPGKKRENRAVPDRSRSLNTVAAGIFDRRSAHDRAGVFPSHLSNSQFVIASDHWQ